MKKKSKTKKKKAKRRKSRDWNSGDLAKSMCGGGYRSAVS